jgi:rare lipoprotein A
MQPERATGVEQAKYLVILSAALALAIDGWPNASTAQTIPTPTPAGQARYVIGKPYQFDGVWYRPAVDYGYDETGVASVYPSSRAGLVTTSGEPYDENAIAAAHKTLPLPSVASVTNLDNGKSIELRINDRGPFVNDRIIELTPAAARLLGISDQATARVRVQIVAAKSKALAAALGGGPGAGIVSPALTPAATVTSLPLRSGPAVQPLKPVVPPAPAAPPLVSASVTPAQMPVASLIPVQTPTNSAPVNRARDAPQAPPSPTNPPRTQAAAIAENFRIQLAALRSEADAYKTWDRILANHNDILRLLRVHIVRADLGSQGIYYRVEAGPFDDKTSAKAICDKLKSVGQQCLVKPWPGDRRSFAPNS